LVDGGKKVMGKKRREKIERRMRIYENRVRAVGADKFLMEKYPNFVWNHPYVFPIQPFIDIGNNCKEWR
jgi:hypothetical protein